MEFSLLISRAGSVDLRILGLEDNLVFSTSSFPIFPVQVRLQMLRCCSQTNEKLVITIHCRMDSQEFNLVKGYQPPEWEGTFRFYNGFTHCGKLKLKSMLNTLQPSTPTDAPPDLGF